LTAALARAREGNPRLAALDSSFSASEGLLEQAGQRPVPTLGVSSEDLLGSGDYTGTQRAQTTVGLSLPLERGGKRAKRLTLAGHESKLAAAEFQVHRNEVLAATALAYTAALAAEQRLALAATTRDQAAELLAYLTARVQAGQASPRETARARIAGVACQTDFARAQTAVATTRASLASFWGGTCIDFPALVGELRIPASLPDAALGLAQITQSPRIAVQQARIASQRAAVALAKSQTASDVTVSAGLRHYQEDGAGALLLGLSMPLPMRQYNQGNLRAARSTLSGAQQTLVAVETELRADHAAAWLELTTAHATVLSLRRDVQPATEEALALVRRGYAQGELPLTEVFDAQRAHTALRRELLEAEWAYANALVRLEALTDPSFPLTAQLLSSR
jgi:cobalt-zinc-cadmium efflux system outer membrane protein